MLSSFMVKYIWLIHPWDLTKVAGSDREGTVLVAVWTDVDTLIVGVIALVAIALLLGRDVKRKRLRRWMYD